MAAQSARTHTCVEWLCSSSQPLGTRNASSVTGMNSSEALMPVHMRPPNFGTANV